MFFQKSIQKTKAFFHKTLQSLKKYLFGSEIPRTLFLNPLSCSSINQRSHELNYIYSQFTDQSVPDYHQDNADNLNKQAINIISSKKDHMANIDAHHNNIINSSYEATANRKKKAVAQSKSEPSSCFSSFRYGNNGPYNILAQKMKELEMMDFDDVDQSLDVEEALHYYSRLTCPVYVDIVNKFFMDMYGEFLPPQPSISVSTSSRRLGPLTL